MTTLRQRRIAELLPPCGVLADVGCDHGKIGFYALKSGKADKVYFIDISEESLNKAKKLCECFGEKAEFLRQDGLGAMRADCAVIAGMGGLEIIGILSRAEMLPTKLILQPMKNADKLRSFVQNRYKIETDYLFYDKKYYNLMYLTCGRDSLSKLEIEFGRTNLQKMPEDFVRYLNKELRLCESVLVKCADEETAKRREEILSLLIKE